MWFICNGYFPIEPLPHILRFISNDNLCPPYIWVTSESICEQFFRECLKSVQIL
jgi:hypothetical protein